MAGLNGTFGPRERMRGLNQLMIRTRKSAWVLTAAAGVFAVTMGMGQPGMAQTPRPQPAVMREGVEAVVNDEIISTYDLKQRMLLLIGRSGVQMTAENQAELQQQALYGLIDERLKMQELRHQEQERGAIGKIIVPDAEIDDEIRQLAARNRLTPEQYYQVLASWGVNPETERERVRAERSWMYWISGFYGRRVRVSDAEINLTLADLTARSNKPSYLIGEIFIDAARAGSVERAVELAGQLIAQMQQNVPFQNVATQFSALPTAANGGDAGWLASGQMRPEVERALEQMRAGQLSQPIPVQDGAYIVYLREKRSGGGSPVVSLKQVATRLSPDAPAAEVQAAQTKLLALKPKITTCATLEQAVEGVDGVAAGDLGEAEVKDLSPAFRDAAERLQPNQVSDPIRTEIGLHLVAVCGRRDSSVELPSREDIKSELENQKLSLIAKREMLNLRSAATIETR